MDINERLEFFRNDRWTVGIIGMGYVGLPLAVTATQRGLNAIGLDVSDARVAQLESGSSHVEDVTDAELAESLANGLTLTTDHHALADADAIFICVPSPLGRNRQPDTTYIESAAAAVAQVAKRGQLISLESTTYPGTTDEIIVGALTAAGLTVDEDVFVSFSPERVDPGNVLKTGDIPKVVGGVSDISGQVAAAAYGRFVEHVHVVSTARAAELTKLLENTYRAVNIALINEMAQLADALDIDIWEVVDAAATKPFGFQAFFPGPGVGGHCIPLDPQYLAWRAREFKQATRFIDLAEQVNSGMPAYVVSRVMDLLNDAGLPLAQTEILAVGLAYKKDIADARESPAVEVLDLLARKGARISVLDPHVPDDDIRKRGYAVADVDGLEKFPMALLLTDHSALDLDAIAARVGTVFDTRGAYRKQGIERENVVAL